MNTDDEYDENIVENDDIQACRRRTVNRLRKVMLFVFGFYCLMLIVGLPSLVRSDEPFTLNDLAIVLPCAGFVFTWRLWHRRMQDLQVLTAIVAISSGIGLYNLIDALMNRSFDRDEIRQLAITHNEAHASEKDFQRLDPDSIPEYVAVFAIGFLTIGVILDVIPLVGVTLLHRYFRKEFA